MTSKATRRPIQDLGGEAELRHYTPEEVYEKRLLPYTPRSLREMCQRYELVHSRRRGPRGAIYFTLPQIRENAKAMEVRPLRETKSARSA